jgi:hypothetical protein
MEDSEKPKDDSEKPKGRPLPPEEHRWKKGQSGNPKGRPKKEDSLTSLLREEIGKPCPLDPQNRTWGQLLIRSTLQDAIKGNPAARKEVWDRADGKVPERQSESNETKERPFEILVTYED